MKCRLFWFQGKTISQAESTLNAWLEHQAKQFEIVEIRQSVGGGGTLLAPAYVVISVWYK